MLRRSFSKALALVLVLCMSLGCCAFATEGEAAQDAVSVPLEAVEVANTEAETDVALVPIEDAVEPVGKTTEEPVTEPAEESAADPEEVPAEEPAADPAEEPVTDPAEEPVVEPVEGTTEEPSAEPAEGIEVEPTADPAEELELPLEGTEVLVLAEADAVAVTEEDCTHENTTCKYDYGEEDYVAANAYFHEYRRECYGNYSCPDCGKEWVKDESYVLHYGHNFDDDDVCEDCGYKCAHEQVENNEFKVESCAPYDEHNHVLRGRYVHRTYCRACRKILEETVDSEITEIMEAHCQQDGSCIVCGYGFEELVCQHEDAYCEVVYEDVEYEQIDAHSHKRIDYLYRAWECHNCGASSEEDWGTIETIEEHYLQDGKCYNCGYVVERCAHKNTGVEDSIFDWEDKLTSVFINDDKTHTVVGYIWHWLYCLDCGKILDEYEDLEMTSIEEPHVFHNGYCDACDYVKICNHPNMVERERYSDANVTYARNDANTHTATGRLYHYRECDDCGTSVFLSVDKEANTWTEEHTFEDTFAGGNICVDCGYVKTSVPVPTPTPTMPAVTDEPIVTPTPTPTAVPTEVPTAVPTEVPTAEPTMPAVTDEPIVTPTDAPTTEPTEMPTEAPTPTTAPTPTMPAVSDTPKATAKPAKETVEAPAAPVYREVPVETELTIAEAMIQVADRATAQGESIRIVNVEKVLTSEELTALNALPVKEQLLTFLSVIGFEEQVNRTLEVRQESLSAEAEALKAQALARNVATQDIFPREVVAIDGMEYNFFELELEVRAGDSVRNERYGFRCEGDEWILTSLEVAE